MEGLALLCNLHADGPLTLRRLRESGIRTLSDLERIQSSSLAIVLHSSATQARRFVEEGKLLASRLEEEPLESEAGPSESSATPYEGRPAPVRVATPASPAHPRAARLAMELATQRSLQVSPEPIPAPTLHALDARALAAPLAPATPAALAQPAATPAIAPLGLAPHRPVEASERETAPERGLLVDVEGTPLHAARLSGLDERTSQRLLEHGVRTLKALVELTSLALARRAGIPYTKLLDLSFQARRFLGERLLPNEPVARTSAAGGDAFELRPESLRGGHSRERLVAEPPRESPPPSTLSSRAVESYGRPWTEMAPLNVPAGTPEDPGPAGPFV